MITVRDVGILIGTVLVICVFMPHLFIISIPTINKSLQEIPKRIKLRVIYMNNIDLEIDLLFKRQEIEHATEDKSDDYREGFRDCAKLLSQWHTLLMEKYFGGDK